MHELALKSAETDATKRALATFGNPFDLALYDREQTGVRQRPNAKTAMEQITQGPWLLRSAAGAPSGTFARPDQFEEALRTAMTQKRRTSTAYLQYGSKTSQPSGL